jgi:hypothetical protein
MTSLMTRMCVEGYLAPDAKPPYSRPSPAWLAYRAGQVLSTKIGVRECLRSRGYSVRVLLWSGEKFHIRFAGKNQSHVVIDEGWGTET